MRRSLRSMFSWIPCRRSPAVGTNCLWRRASRNGYILYVLQSGDRAGAVFAHQQRAAGEPVERIGRERNIGGLTERVLGENLADARRELEAVAGEAEADYESLDIGDLAQHRIPVGRDVVD